MFAYMYILTTETKSMHALISLEEPYFKNMWTLWSLNTRVDVCNRYNNPQKKNLKTDFNLEMNEFWSWPSSRLNILHSFENNSFNAFFLSQSLHHILLHSYILFKSICVEYVVKKLEWNQTWWIKIWILFDDSS